MHPLRAFFKSHLFANYYFKLPHDRNRSTQTHRNQDQRAARCVSRSLASLPTARVTAPNCCKSMQLRALVKCLFAFPRLTDRIKVSPKNKAFASYTNKQTKRHCTRTNNPPNRRQLAIEPDHAIRNRVVNLVSLPHTKEIPYARRSLPRGAAADGNKTSDRQNCAFIFLLPLPFHNVRSAVQSSSSKYCF